MSQSTKTDNHNPAAKLALRRYFLDKYHVGRVPLPGASEFAPLRVLDCCQGEMKLWSTLRAEYSVAEYLGVDLKPKHGRLKIDSVRILDQPGWSFNVIDIDTYGSPWKHWQALLKHARAPVTVFLTIGMCKRQGGCNFDEVTSKVLAFHFKNKIPAGIAAHLQNYATEIMLTLPSEHGLQILECQEAENQGNARYLGLQLGIL